MLFGCVGLDPRETSSILMSMSAALRVVPDEVSETWTFDSMGIGVLERPLGKSERLCEPARGADGSLLWFTGEAFDWPSQGGLLPCDSRTAGFRSRLVEAILARGPGVVRDLDGEYQVAVWNPSTRSLLLINDRFAALPLYFSEAADGTVAFAGGVRGVLTVPGIGCDPDPDAIREAVTFGGYRLGGRTNIRGVEMMAPASVVTVSGGRRATKRYWTWAELADGDATDERTLMEETRASWSDAVKRRLDGASRPGLTLSGGLDSRAILAEVSRRGVAAHALTYGVPQADDVRFARRAAAAAGARWELFPLYTDGWLERRTHRIHETDGLMDLVDLMHTEAFDRMPEAFDLYLSGYIGDVVVGSTHYFVDPEHLLRTMPYYGGELAIPFHEARALSVDLARSIDGPPRFAAYEHKLFQSISRITAAARPYVTVRRPFVDYRFFETCQRVPFAWRANQQWRERWLVSTYPALFARIPNQQSGVPPQSSRMRWQVTRAARFAWRRTLKAVQSAGMHVTVPERTYHPDERYWSQAPARAAITNTILRRGSLCCGIFGRERVQGAVERFFEAGGEPVQVIGAMYVFEHYHQTLVASLNGAKRQVGAHPC